VRRHTDLPLVVGFGISKAQHIRQLSAYADGAIVASALINTIDQLPPEQLVDGAAAFVRRLRAT
jgi:tryptophan synthase alpha chain